MATRRSRGRCSSPWADGRDLTRARVRTVRMRRRGAILAALVLALAVPAGVARAGGSLRGYVLLPASGRLVIVDVDAARVVGSVAVPRGSGPLVASIDGRRVLVANPRRGIVTEIDGVAGRRTRTIAGLGDPVAILLVPRADVGLVRPRYALVADGRGWIDTLDLDTGTLAARIAVGHPSVMAMANGQLWVASAGRATLTQLDVGDPARPRVVARPSIGLQPVGLAIDSGIAIGVDGVSLGGSLVQLDGVALARTRIRALGTPITQLLGGDGGLVWAAGVRGRVLGVRARDGRVVDVMHVPPGSRLSLAGGWLAATHGRSLGLVPLGTTRRPRTIALPGAAGDAAFSVQP